MAIDRGRRRRCLAALVFGGEAHHDRREPLLERLEGARIGDLGIDAEAHGADHFALRIAHGNRHRVTRALARAVLDRVHAGVVPRQTVLDQLVILGQQEILAQEERICGEVMKRDAAHLRCQRTDELREGIERLARGGLGRFCQVVQHLVTHSRFMGDILGVEGAARNVAARRRKVSATNKFNDLHVYRRAR